MKKRAGKDGTVRDCSGRFKRESPKRRRYNPGVQRGTGVNHRVYNGRRVYTTGCIPQGVTQGGYLPICLLVYPGWIPPYMPPSVPWVYPTLYIHHLEYRERYLPWVYASLLHPGYTSMLHPAAVHRMLPLAAVRWLVTMLWAQEGRNPWVEASLASRVLKSVKREGRSLRIVTPLLPVINVRRLDRRRVFPTGLPWVKACCAEWSRSLRSSDRCGMWRDERLNG